MRLNKIVGIWRHACFNDLQLWLLPTYHMKSFLNARRSLLHRVYTAPFLPELKSSSALKVSTAIPGVLNLKWSRY